MNITKDSLFFVFDVESIGLHGEGFAVGGGLYTATGTARHEFCYACPPAAADGLQSSHEWVAANVPPIEKTHSSPFELRWAFVRRLKDLPRDIIICAECPWPVEAQFLQRCIVFDAEIGPYPLIDITSIMLAARMDPMATYERQPPELPVHNPLCDARLSMRLLVFALCKLGIV